MRITVDFEFDGADTDDRWFAVWHKLGPHLSELCERMQPTGWRWAVRERDGTINIDADPPGTAD